MQKAFLCRHLGGAHLPELPTATRRWTGDGRVARGDAGACLGKGSRGNRRIRTNRDPMATQTTNNSEREDWRHQGRTESDSAAYSHLLLTEDPLHRLSGL